VFESKVGISDLNQVGPLPGIGTGQTTTAYVFISRQPEGISRVENRKAMQLSVRTESDARLDPADGPWFQLLDDEWIS
jgi:hypothetical protein